MIKDQLKYEFTLIAISLIIGVTLNLINLFNLPGVKHDETYTIIRSVGQGPIYSNIVKYGKPPVMTETTNAEWLALMQINSNSSIFNDFININKYVAGNTHPPLPDMLLHLWIKYFGFSLFGIKLFNIFIYAISVVTFYFIAKELFEFKLSLFALIVYSISYVHLTVTGEVRSYALFGLWNLLAFYFVIKIIKSQFANNTLWWILLTIVSICGLYTHYVYSLVFLPIFFFLFSSLLKDKNRQQHILLWKSLTFIVISLIPLAISLWIHRETTMSIAQQWVGERAALAALNWEYFASLSGMYRGYIYSLPNILNILIAILINLICIYGIIKTNSLQVRNLILILFLSNSIGYILLYKLDIFPIHAIGPKYQIAFFPYFLISIVYVIKSFKNRLLFIGCAVGLISFIVFGNINSYINTKNNVDRIISRITIQKRMPKVDLVILDSVAEGLVGPVINSFPEKQPILIGSQKDLADKNVVAEIASGKKSVAYINALKYHNKNERRNKIIDQINVGLGYKTSLDNIKPAFSLGCRGCGKGYNVFIFKD